MTKKQIEDYLYFFWAPLLQAGVVSDDDMDGFKKRIILTFSQTTVYIEAPEYKAGRSSHEFSDDIKKEISEFANKILANIPVSTKDDSYWLKITVSALIPAEIISTDTFLLPDRSFGPYKIVEDKSIAFDFYYLPHQLQIKLPTTTEISAIISTHTPIELPDGAVTNINIDDCTLWLSAIQLDAAVGDPSLYFSVRLKQCNIDLEEGYTKVGSKITPGVFNFHIGFVITCIPENTISEGAGITVAAGNTVIYPSKFVFSFKHRPGLPQPPKITFTHTEPFSATLFGSIVNTLTTSDIKAGWIADKKLLSFPLLTENDSFSATNNVSPVFNFKGEGRMENVGWYFPVVSIDHPLALARLGIAAEAGYIGFDINDEFSLSWKGLENGPIKLKKFFLHSSPDTLSISYTANPAMLAKQQLKLWKRTANKKSHSVIEMNFTKGGTGSFISRRKSNEIHILPTKIDVDIDCPLLSNGDRIFLKTSGALMLMHDDKVITAVLAGIKMDPADAFENSSFRQLSSFVLSNALILVNPVQLFLVVGNLDTSDVMAEGICHILFPVKDIEHILPDPYITSVFNNEPEQDDQPNPVRRLKVVVRWSEVDDAALNMEFVENDDALKPTEKLPDEKLADQLLRFPLPHPAAEKYEELLRNAIGASTRIPVNIVTDQEPYGGYQSIYHSKKNTTGAFYMLHILPGNVSLVDVSGRASQMGVAFTRNLRNTENGILAVLENTGYTVDQTFRIDNNELVSSGRFVRVFTLPQVQWEPVYFAEKNGDNISFEEKNPFPAHGVPTRIASANKAEVALTPGAVTKYIVEGFQDEKNKYAAAAHFALPFGMNAVALFHPFVDGVGLPTLKEVKVKQNQIPDPYSYSIVKFNQPDFNLKKGALSGAIQIKVTSEGLPKIPRDKIQFPDPSFHGAVLQIPNQFNKLKVANGVVVDLDDDSILGDIITKRFNRVMWGEYKPQGNTLTFLRSANAKVPLRRIDFSGFGASIFSNWLNKHAKAGSVSQVKFNIFIGRVAHEVIQIKSVIIPWFVPVVRSIILERKNHANIIRTDTGWVATGPGEFHRGYDCHPGVIKGVYNVTSIKDTTISLQQTIKDKDGNPVKDKDGNPVIVDMAGVYFDADVKIENVVSGFKNTEEAVESNYKLVPSKKQFGYILLGNPDDGVKLENYFTKVDLQNFMSRPDVGALGGPVDCIVNIAGSDQMMHLTRIDVTTAKTAQALVVAAKGTLHLPKGGSWSVVKKITNGATLSLTKDETVPLIRNGKLQFDGAGNPTVPDFKNSLHVLGNLLEIEKYEAGLTALADTEYALLQSTGTQKLLFPRPSFDSGNTEVVDGITRVKPEILVTNPVMADPYSLLKGKAIFPDDTDALTLGNVKGTVKSLLISKENSGISFPADVIDKLEGFVPFECIVPNNGTSRKLYLVNEESFKIYIDYGGQVLPDGKEVAKQLFTAALNGDGDNNRWKMMNKEVAIVVELGPFKPLLTVKGDFTAEPGAKPKFDNAKIEWGPDGNLKKIIEVLSILSMLSSQGSSSDIIKDGFSFVMGNSPDSWNYKCTIEEKIPVIKFPNAKQLAQLPVPAPLIVEAGLNLGVFFNLSLSADPNNLVRAGAGVALGFEATIQVLLITIEAATAYGVGTAKVEVFVELPDAKPTFKFTMGFGATVAVQLPMVGYVSLTRVISLGVSIDNGTTMTAGQMLRGVLTIGGGLASVTIQVEASGTVTNKNAGVDPGEWTAIVRGVFTLDITVLFVVNWDFSEEFEHEIDLPHPF